MLARLPLTTEEDGDTGWPTDDIISLDLGDDAGPAGGPKANKPAMDWIATLEAPSTASSPKRPRSGETTDVIAPQEKKAAPDNQTSPQNPRGNCTSCEEDARIPPCSKQAAVMGCPLCPTISVCAGHSMVHQLQTGHTLQPLPEVDALQQSPALSPATLRTAVEAPAATPPTPVAFPCALHPTISITHFCLSDGTSVCVQCVLDGHRESEHRVVSLEEAMARLKGSLSRVRTKALAEVEVRAAADARFAEAETSLSSSEALAVSAVDAEIGRLKALLDGCRESAVGSIQALCNSQRACIALQRASLAETSSALGSAVTACETALSSPSPPELQSAIADGRSALKGLPTVKALEAAITQVTVSFPISSKIESLLPLFSSASLDTAGSPAPAPKLSGRSTGVKVIGQDPASASKARRFIEDDDEGPGSAQTVVNIIGEPGSGQVGVPIIRAPTVAPVATVAPADKSAEVLDVPMQSGEAVESAVSAFASEDELTASAAAALVKSGGKPGDLSTPKPSRSSSKESRGMRDLALSRILPLPPGAVAGIAVNSACTCVAVTHPVECCVYVFTIDSGSEKSSKRRSSESPSSALAAPLKLGSEGSEPGKLSIPSGLCFVGGTDNILVADSGNDRIVEFSVSSRGGKHIRSVPAGLTQPDAIACSGCAEADVIAVSSGSLPDLRTGACAAITIFGYDQRRRRKMRSILFGSPLFELRGVVTGLAFVSNDAVDAEPSLVACDAVSPRLHVFSTTGDFEGSIVISTPPEPADASTGKRKAVSRSLARMSGDVVSVITASPAPPTLQVYDIGKKSLAMSCDLGGRVGNPVALTASAGNWLVLDADGPTISVFTTLVV